MKNIHILPTKNQSRLYFDVVTKKLLLQERLSLNATCFPIEKRNIYITNDEEIKDEDWTLKFPFQKEIFKNIEVSINEYVKRAKLHTYPYNWCQKIILTTDPDLIKDGVQAIDDEFLEWFVKNPSCEEVEVKWVKTPDGIFYTNDVPYGCYKIIIPKEIDTLELGQIKIY